MQRDRSGRTRIARWWLGPLLAVVVVSSAGCPGTVTPTSIATTAYMQNSLWFFGGGYTLPPGADPLSHTPATAPASVTRGVDPLGGRFIDITFTAAPSAPARTRAYLDQGGVQLSYLTGLPTGLNYRLTYTPKRADDTYEPELSPFSGFLTYQLLSAQDTPDACSGGPSVGILGNYYYGDGGSHSMLTVVCDPTGEIATWFAGGW